MPHDPTGLWYPKMFPKQLDVFNSHARALLCCGPRLSGKTRAVLHKVVRHLWDTDGARVGMFVRTMKSSKDGGAWSLMVKSILPEWFRSGIGMRYTSSVNGVYGPKVDGITRTPFFKVLNRYGTESEMLLFSLDNDDAAENKLKELEFSMIYFSELDKFGDRKVLTVALPSLRMGHLTFEQQQWIADCNPAEDGEQSWIHRVFYRERGMTHAEYTKYQKENNLPMLPEAEFTSFYTQLGVIEILPQDNVFVDPRQLQEVKVACAADEGLYARHILGQWVWGGGDASRHFKTSFKERLHVVGDVSESDEDNWIVPLPHDSCFEIITGWDLGDKNHACVLIDKYHVNGKACFVVMDEIITIGEEIGNTSFTDMVMEKIEAMEKRDAKKYELSRAWSDRNSLEKFSATGDTYPYLEVLAASGHRILLRGVGREAKAKGSVRYRVQMVKELLAEGRLKVGANCKRVIKMFHELKKGQTSSSDFVVQNEDKHPFDALSYALFMEMAESLELGNRNQKSGTGLILSV